jgi:hypothetical protein
VKTLGLRSSHLLVWLSLVVPSALWLISRLPWLQIIMCEALRSTDVLNYSVRMGGLNLSELY